ncbi:cytochrome P450 [Mycena rosella]|uniref:Cytochrome P450 n=1 Tax=Mycena rosella TaxID=1033263 RepID=A0AAD7DCG6_MYCRO|nr:cytochrome P450 [Mycena rosella]
MPSGALNICRSCSNSDLYGISRYIPSYLRPLREAHKEELTLSRSQLDVVRQKMVLIFSALGRYALIPDRNTTEKFPTRSGSSMFGAGSDTTASAISVAVMAAACFPGAQARVQAELDAIIGPPRLRDKDMLPQTTAFMLETFRWRPVAPAGSFFSIEKLLHPGRRHGHWEQLVTLRSIGRDPEVFPRPEDFDPQRLITADGKLRDDLNFFTFGFGRRICPGQTLAIGRVVPVEHGFIDYLREIAREDPSSLINIHAFTLTFNVRPEPFAPIFKPRIGADFAAVRAMLEQDV